jgi:DNA-binding transcriptional LysR family regulator
LFEIPFSTQLNGLRHDLYDAGFALAGDAEDGIITEPVWRDLLVAAVPSRHPLLVHKHVPLSEVVNYPLVLCQPEACVGCSQQVERLLRPVKTPPIVAERVVTHDLMLALVAAGYGVGFSSAALLAAYHHKDVVVRPLAGRSFMTTFLLRPDNEPSEQLRNFIHRVNRVDS